MAGDNALTRMQREITELNRQHGYAREDGPPTDASGWSAPAASPEEAGPGQPRMTKDNQMSASSPTGEEVSGGSPGQGGTSVGLNTPTVDPGLPRFSHVNLDMSLAIIQGSNAIPLTESETKAIAAICMTALNRHLVSVFTSIGANHGIEIKQEEASPPTNQMEIPFEPKPGKRNGRNPK